METVTLDHLQKCFLKLYMSQNYKSAKTALGINDLQIRNWCLEDHEFNNQLQNIKNIKIRATKYKRRITYKGKLLELLKDARKRAKRKNQEFKLTFEDLNEIYKEQKGLCAYSDAMLLFDVPPRHSRLISLDKKNPSGLYEKINVCFCTLQMNHYKSCKSYEHFKDEVNIGLIPGTRQFCDIHNLDWSFEKE